MKITEIVEDPVSVSAMAGGIIIRRSRSETSLLQGDRNRYSQDVKSLVRKFLQKGSIKPDTKIWLGDPKQKEGEIIGTAKTIALQQYPPPYLRLFHGTSSVRWENIQKNGLIPLSLKDRVWKTGNDITKREDAIYLTAVRPQAEYYAMKTVEADGGDAKPVILSVIIPASEYGNLIPDDDYESEQKDAPNNWQQSLSFYGQVAYIKPIHADQIRLYGLGSGAKQISQ